MIRPDNDPEGSAPIKIVNRAGCECTVVEENIHPQIIMKIKKENACSSK